MLTSLMVAVEAEVQTVRAVAQMDAQMDASGAASPHVLLVAKDLVKLAVPVVERRVQVTVVALAAFYVKQTRNAINTSV